MTDDVILRLIIEQRKRLIATLMGSAEGSEWWRTLSKAEQLAYRERVLSSVGVFYDFIRDVVKVTNEGWMISDEAVNMIAQIHAGQADIRASLIGVKSA